MGECKVVNAVDLRTVKVGDRVYEIESGWGTVVEVEPCNERLLPYSHAIRVVLDLFSGEFTCASNYDQLFYGPPKIIGPEKPKVKVKKQLWVVYAQEKGINGCFGIKKAAEGYIKSSGLIGIASIHPVEIEVEE